MSAQTVTLDEACAHIAELLNAVAKGQEVLVTKDARPVARLIPADMPRPSSSRKSLFGCLKDRIAIADDFDAPLPDLEAYMR